MSPVVYNNRPKVYEHYCRARDAHIPSGCSIVGNILLTASLDVGDLPSESQNEGESSLETRSRYNVWALRKNNIVMGFCIGGRYLRIVRKQATYYAALLQSMRC